MTEEYTLLAYSDPGKLSIAVNQLFMRGWILYGYPIVVPLHTGGDTMDQLWHYQAMVSIPS